MGESESGQVTAAAPPKREWGKFLLLIGLPLLLFAGLAGYARLRVEASDEVMHKAVGARQLSKVRWLLRLKPSLANAPETERAGGGWLLGKGVRTVLFSAVDNDDAQMLALLISKGADLKATNENGWSPLAAALRTDRMKAAAILLRCGAPIDAGALAQAACHHSDYLELFLKRGADVNCRSASGHSPLMIAAAETNAAAGSEGLRLLLAHHADPNARDKSRRTALFYAARPGQLEGVKLLLSHGANPNVKDSNGFSALSAAVQWGSTAAAETLLNNRADPKLDPRTLNFATQLSPSAPGIVEMLIAHGADPKFADSYRQTPLHIWALYRIELKVGQVLLAHGADPNARDKMGRTPLFAAARYGETEAVKLLLAHGAFLNVRDANGHTALLDTVASRNEAMIEVLLKNGADPNLDPMILGIAKRLKPPALRIVEMLIAHGAKDQEITVHGHGE